MHEPPLARQIERQIAARTGQSVAVQEQDGRLRLSGRINSEEARDTAGEIAARMAGGRGIDNDLNVDWSLADDVASLGPDPRANDPIESLNALDENGDLAPDFTDEPLDTDVIDVVQEGDNVYFPPTDPVIDIGRSGHAEVLGGFEPTSDTTDEVDPSAEDGLPGDEALAAAIARELHEDAATTDLRIDVVVRNGIAHLHGLVPDLDDAENAEGVASRVPGIVEVREELRVQGL